MRSIPLAPWLSLLSALSLTAVLALAGCGNSDRPGAAASASAGAQALPKLLISPEDLVTLQPRTLASGPTISGSIQPERRADLRAEVAAVVLQVLKENGEAVRSGDLLMRLDDTAIRDSLRAAEESVRASEQSFEQTERQAQRLKSLQAQGMISVQGYEDAQIRRNNAQSDLVAARARLVAARQQQRRTEVRAPFDGVVSDRKASVGDTVQVGRELVKVIDPRSMRFEGLVAADRLSELKVGQTVSFRVNGYERSDFVGSIRRIDSAANATTRQVEVIVGFGDAAATPRVSGLFAEGRVQTGSAQALLLSQSSLQRAGETAWVWRVDGQAVAKVGVKLGPRDPRSGEYPVLSGLNPGDRILRNPGTTLVDGQRVELVRPAAATSASAAAAARN